MLEYPEECIDKRGSEYLMGVFNEIARSMGVGKPAEAIALFREMMKAMDLCNPVSENRDADLKVLASSVNPVRLKNNPIELNNKCIIYLYSHIL